MDVTLRRYRDLTGIEPLHLESGLTFKEREYSGAPALEPQGVRRLD